MDEVVFSTSGSTGAAKRIIRSESSLMADASVLVAVFPEFWGRNTVVVSSVRPEHMYGALWRVRAPALAGCAVEPSVLVSVEELSELCRRHGKILFATTPSFLEKALEHPDFALLRGYFAGIVTSGSLLRAETSAATAKVTGCCPTEIFGSTETGTVAFRRQSEGELWNVVDGVGVSVSSEGLLIVDSPYAKSRPYVMGDRVETVSPRTFRLCGRADRQVKILERYVSLTEVEAAFSGHPFVRSVRVEAMEGAVSRLGALVVLSPEGCAALSDATAGALASRLRRDLLSRIALHAFPRRIRFVRELPVNEQGKTTAAAVRARLSAWCREPAVLSWERTGTSLKAELVFTPDMECFRGHFPGLPVLPGVAQIFFLRHFARQVFADFPDAVTFRRLKFQKLVLPGQRISLSVERTEAGAFAFSLVRTDGACCSGLAERTGS